MPPTSAHKGDEGRPEKVPITQLSIAELGQVKERVQAEFEQWASKNNALGLLVNRFNSSVHAIEELASSQQGEHETSFTPIHPCVCQLSQSTCSTTLSRKL